MKKEDYFNQTLLVWLITVRVVAEGTKLGQLLDFMITGFGRWTPETNRSKTSVCLIFLFLGIMKGQVIEHNYAPLNSTTISAEYLSKEMVLQTVDGNSGWNGSWIENNWYKFNFKDSIDINAIEIVFFENTCLGNCKLGFELILKDTIINFSVNNLFEKIIINRNSDFIILNRKSFYPKGAGHINEIKIFSSTNPGIGKKGLPKVDFSKRSRSKIYSQITAHDTTYSAFKAKSARVLKSFKKIDRELLFSKEIRKDMLDAAKMGNYQKLTSNLFSLFHDDWCSDTEKMAKELIKLDIPLINSMILAQATCNYVDIDCSSITSLSVSSFGSYTIPEVEAHYKKEKDVVSLAHGALLLCQLSDDKILDQLITLKDAENVFARFTYAQLLHYFNRHEASKVVIRNIIEEDIRSLNNEPPFTANYVYTAWSIKLLLKINAEEASKYHALVKNLCSDALAYYDKVANKTADQMNRQFPLEGLDYKLNKVYQVKSCK